MSATLILQVDSDALRRLRLSKALTQRDLARAAGISRMTISRLEQGSPASTYSVKRIAAVLGVEYADFVQVVTV